MKSYQEASREIPVKGEDDVKEEAGFDDAICYNSFFVDIHHIDGPGMDKSVWRPGRGFKYQVPYRILVPQKVDNLLVAGRCVSCTHVALGSLRVMVPCMAMGEAAGVAAALSLSHGITPRQVDTRELQQALRRAGGILCEKDIAG